MQLPALATLISLMLLSSCTGKPYPQSEAQSRKLDAKIQQFESAQAALEHWLKQRPAEFSLTMQRTCFCLPEFVQPMNLIITNGEILSATFVESGDTVPLQVFKSLRNIESWLLRIGELEEKENAELKTEYDPIFGYPSYFYVDRHPRIADDTEELKITNFTALP